MANDVVQSDPWLLTDRYNREAKSLDPEFNDARHDQSILSVSRKIVGSIVISDEIGPRQLQFPFWASDLDLDLPSKNYYNIFWFITVL